MREVALEHADVVALHARLQHALARGAASRRSATRDARSTVSVVGRFGRLLRALGFCLAVAWPIRCRRPLAALGVGRAASFAACSRVGCDRRDACAQADLRSRGADHCPRGVLKPTLVSRLERRTRAAHALRRTREPALSGATLARNRAAQLPPAKRVTTSKTRVRQELSLLFLGPSGLAVGLALKELRYAGNSGDSPLGPSVAPFGFPVRRRRSGRLDDSAGCLSARHTTRTARSLSRRA